ncbi:hypothetical protein M501DRAFT_1016586 [Patellaria atrata CBS 101060]|uniref:Uncharacterized protein n=1 Tax=Patellaria atrata CBS 101060 TaxID=1346257 RepID=A0A9P4SB31_9PEZI|nr:hypothetical protein M501DRAFT_1016586 [Patellaria atrata CBS 101060]
MASKGDGERGSWSNEAIFALLGVAVMIVLPSLALMWRHRQTFWRSWRNWNCATPPSVTVGQDENGSPVGYQGRHATDDIEMNARQVGTVDTLDNRHPIPSYESPFVETEQARLAWQEERSLTGVRFRHQGDLEQNNDGALTD